VNILVLGEFEHNRVSNEIRFRLALYHIVDLNRCALKSIPRFTVTLNKYLSHSIISEQIERNSLLDIIGEKLFAGLVSPCSYIHVCQVLFIQILLSFVPKTIYTTITAIASSNICLVILVLYYNMP
jgi:hypothetical protein